MKSLNASLYQRYGPVGNVPEIFLKQFPVTFGLFDLLVSRLVSSIEFACLIAACSSYSYFVRNTHECASCWYVNCRLGRWRIGTLSFMDRRSSVLNYQIVGTVKITILQYCSDYAFLFSLLDEQYDHIVVWRILIDCGHLAEPTLHASGDHQHPFFTLPFFFLTITKPLNLRIIESKDDQTDKSSNPLIKHSL